MKRCTIGLLLCLLGANVVAKEIVTICYDEWPPAKIRISEQDGVQQSRGFVVDMLRDIYAKHGYTVHFKQLPYARALQEVQFGRCDLEPATVFNTNGSGLFPSTPSYQSPYIFFIRDRKLSHYQGPSSLKGIILGTLRGYNYSNIDASLQQYIDKGEGVRNIAGSGGVVRVFQLMEKGYVDAFYEDIHVGCTIVRNIKASHISVLDKGERKLFPLYPMFSPAKNNAAKTKTLIEIYEQEMELDKNLIEKYIAETSQQTTQPFPAKHANTDACGTASSP